MKGNKWHCFCLLIQHKFTPITILMAHCLDIYHSKSTFRTVVIVPLMKPACQSLEMTWFCLRAWRLPIDSPVKLQRRLVWPTGHVDIDGKAILYLFMVWSVGHWRPQTCLFQIRRATCRENARWTKGSMKRNVFICIHFKAHGVGKTLWGGFHCSLQKMFKGLLSKETRTSVDVCSWERLSLKGLFQV